MYTITVVSLAVVMALCVIGTFSCVFDDNLAQRVGMIFIFLGFIPKLKDVIQTHDIVPGAWMAYAGLAAYAVGTSWKAWKHRKSTKQNILETLDKSKWRHVAGGKR